MTDRTRSRDRFDTHTYWDMISMFFVETRTRDFEHKMYAGRSLFPMIRPRSRGGLSFGPWGMPRRRNTTFCVLSRGSRGSRPSFIRMWVESLDTRPNGGISFRITDACVYHVPVPSGVQTKIGYLCRPTQVLPPACAPLFHKVSSVPNDNVSCAPCPEMRSDLGRASTFPA